MTADKNTVANRKVICDELLEHARSRCFAVIPEALLP